MIGKNRNISRLSRFVLCITSLVALNLGEASAVRDHGWVSAEDEHAARPAKRSGTEYWSSQADSYQGDDAWETERARYIKAGRAYVEDAKADLYGVPVISDAPAYLVSDAPCTPFEMSAHALERAGYLLDAISIRRAECISKIKCRIICSSLIAPYTSEERDMLHSSFHDSFILALSDIRSLTTSPASGESLEVTTPADAYSISLEQYGNREIAYVAAVHALHDVLFKRRYDLVYPSVLELIDVALEVGSASRGVIFADSGRIRARFYKEALSRGLTPSEAYRELKAVKLRGPS